MLARSMGALMALLLLTPVPVWALGLGDIQVRSALNQRLDARIDIVGAAPGELVDVSAQLADAETFERTGVARPYVLTTLRFETVQLEDGSGYVKVTSTKRIREPALTFIVELNSPKSTLRRTYSVLLETN